MNKSHKIALGVLLTALLLAAVVAVSFAAGKTARMGFVYGSRFGTGYGTVDTVTGALGLRLRGLPGQRIQGKTLADVAKDNGVDIEKLKESILESRKAFLEKRVEQGAITQERADAILKQTESHINFMLENGMGLGCGLGAGAGFGPGGMMGFGARGGWWQNTEVQ